jgi:predicted O-methyltransferase YrrM
LTSKSALKSLLKGIPVIGPFLVRLRRREGSFKSSADLWEQRYRAGGDSGPGSYNRLAEFKARFLNQFVNQNQIASVIELGSGDGAQLKLAQYPAYTGIDIAPKAVEICRSLFSDDRTKQFLVWDSAMPDIVADLSLSLDVVFHLVEDHAFDAYMRRLFASARRFVIVYSNNMDRKTPAKHVRHRQFTRWVEQNAPDWRLHSTLKNDYPYDEAYPEQTSFADFYVFSPREEPK